MKVNIHCKPLRKSESKFGHLGSTGFLADVTPFYGSAPQVASDPQWHQPRFSWFQTVNQEHSGLPEDSKKLSAPEFQMWLDLVDLLC